MVSLQDYQVVSSPGSLVRRPFRTQRPVPASANETERLLDDDAEYEAPQDMLAEMADDNRRLTGFLRATHAVCETYDDVASTSLIELWIDEAERRSWVLYESTRGER